MDQPIAPSKLGGKTICVTGGSGSFGQAFIKRVLSDYTPRQIRCLSRDEHKQSEFAAQLDDQRVRFLLGDVRDYRRLQLAFRGVDIVVHAAALKQVPAGEYDPAEFVKTNIMGSMNVVEAALWAGVEKALALSSDKAVAPLNNYGSTKRCMETLFMAANAYRGPKSYPAYSCTRYGNVAGSAASVIPIFREKQAAGEPLPITDERMSRFHMTMDDAVDFVLMALDRMQGGEIYIPKLPSFRVTHLAEAFGGRREIIGLRPGEKLAEVLISRDESFNAYDLGDCYALASRELGERVPDVPGGFQLASDDNGSWLGPDELREALRDI